MTKEEILCKHIGGENPEDLQTDLILGPDLSNILRAMDEHAKQQAIAFGEWLSDHPLILEPASGTEFWIGIDFKIQTTSDLYTQFLNQQK